MTRASLLLPFLAALLLIPTLFVQSAHARASSEGLTIRGVALGPEGEPVPGQAALIPLISRFELARFHALGQPRSPAVDTVPLGADGGFRLKAPEIGFWVVAVEAPEMTTVEMYLSPLTASVDLPTLRMESAGERIVVVRDRAGQPVASALVLGLPVGPPHNGAFPGSFGRTPWSPQQLLGRTDDQGRVRLRPFADQDLEVAAWAPGFLPSEKVPMRSGTLEIALEAGIGRTVRVLQPSGRPAAEALVEIGSFDWPAGWTDEEGRLTFTAPASAPFPLSLSTQEVRMTKLSLPARDARQEAHEAGEAETVAEKEAVFTLAEPRYLEASVVEEDSEGPVPDAIVWQPTDAPGFCRTDRTGACALRFSPREPWSSVLRAAAAGYRWTIREIPPSSSASELVLRPATEIRGRVVDVHGAPVEGAEVSAASARRRPGLFLHPAGVTARTTADGRFLLPGVEPGSRLRVTALRDGYAPGKVEVITAAAGEAAPAVEIVLPEGAQVFGFVLDEDGLPIPGAEVRMGLSPSGEELSGFGRLRRRFSSDWISTATDEEGRFEAAHLEAGSYAVSATFPGFAPQGLRGVELSEGGPAAEIGPLILPAGVSLEGRVTDSNGVPLEGAEVEVGNENRPSFMSSLGLGSGEGQATDVDGRFQISDLTAGSKVRVSVRREGYLRHSLPGVQVPLDRPLEISLEEAFVLRGRILDPGGETVADGRAILTVAEGTVGRFRPSRGRRQAYSGSSDAGGSFEIKGVPPGVYSLSASAEGFQPSRAVEVEVGPRSGERAHDLVLKPGATMTGRVFAPNGEPLEEAHVWIQKVSPGDEPFQGHASTKTDVGGDFQLEGVPSGTVSIHANHRDYTEATKEVQVPPGGAVTVDLTLAQGYEVSGRVVQASGEPVIGAEVRLTQQRSGDGRSSIGVVSNSEGKFSFKAVEPGRYQVSSATPELPASTQEEIEVEGGDVFGVEVVLTSGTNIRGLVTGLDDSELATVEVRASNQRRASFQAQLRQDGSYRLGPLSPGVWSLQAVVGSGGRQRREQVNVEEGMDEILVDFSFTIGTDLSGRVLQGGEPLPGAPVRAEGLDVGASSSGRTDFEGNFHLEDLEEGTYWLTVRDPMVGAEHGEEVTVGSSGPVEIEMPSAIIAGRILSAVDGGPLSRAVVEVSLADPRPGFRSMRSRSAWTDAEGRFQLEGFAGGSWRLVANKQGFAQEERRVTISESGVDDLEISLHKTEGLLLDVVLPDGRPASIVKALLFDGAGRSIGFREMEGERGRFHLESAPPGVWYLQLSAERDAAATTLVVETPGEPVPVQLQGAGWLSLRVPLLEESRMPAAVSIRRPAGVPFLPHPSSRSPQQTTFHLSAGRLHRQLLPPGTWQLEVTAADGTAWSGTVVVQSGTTVEAALE